MLDFRPAAEFAILFLPHTQQLFHFSRLKLGQGETVVRTVTDDSRYTLSRAVAIDSDGCRQVLRRFGTDTGHVVIKDERAGVVVVVLTVDAHIARAEITVRDIIRNRLLRMFDDPATPGTILPVRSNDHPFFAQRMPSLFPN